VTDSLGRNTSYGYDPDGNVTSVTELYGTPNAVTTTYTFDYTKFDQLKQIQNGLGKNWFIGLDSSGNAISVTDPLNREWQAAYNSNGSIASLTDPAASTNPSPYNGPLLTYAYNSTDDLHVVTQRATDTETYTYSVDAVGRILKVMGPPMDNQTTTYTYDDKDETTSVVDPNGYSTTYVYNWNGNLRQLTDANGNLTSWDWTPPLTVSSWNVKECDPSGSCAHYLVENAGGVLDEYDDKRGVVNSFDHYNLGRITKAHYDVNGLLGHGTMNDSYTYDLANRLTGIVHASQGTPCGGNTDSFTYDGLDDVLTTCTPEGSLVYHYDLIGRKLACSPPALVSSSAIHPMTRTS